MAVIYVSRSQGRDSYDGLSEQTPKRSVASGRALVRDRSDDQLLFRRGDVWSGEGLGHWMKSGLSLKRPLVIGSYGTDDARPILDTGTSNGFETSPGGGSPATVDYVALKGLHLVGAGEGYGVRALQPATGFHVHDCIVEGYGQNISFQAFPEGQRHDAFAVTRSIIIDATQQGLYTDGVHGFKIEDSLFDSNGAADIFSHNLYIDNGCSGVTVRRNIIADAGSHGLQLRCGGMVSGNVFVRNPIALLVGGGNAPNDGGVEADVLLNCILDGRDIDANTPRGWGVTFANIRAGRFSANLIAHGRGKQPSILTLEADPAINGGAGVGVHKLHIVSNIAHDWGGYVAQQGVDAMLTGIRWDNNDWDGRYRYVDPVRDLASYAGMLGGPATHEAFIKAARSRGAGEWLPKLGAAAVNGYMRDGFKRAK